jgi:hypothetical protein
MSEANPQSGKQVEGFTVRQRNVLERLADEGELRFWGWEAGTVEILVRKGLAAPAEHDGFYIATASGRQRIAAVRKKEREE